MSKMKYFPHLAGSLVLASTATIAMLDKWEPDKTTAEARLVVYADKLAQGLPTVCNGITKHVSTIPVIVGDVWTPDMCREQQEQAITKVQLEVAQCFKVLPPQSVFDSAFDHAWNNGSDRTCASQSMGFWNKGNWLVGCRLLTYTFNGKPNWSSVKTGNVLSNGKPEYKFVQGLHNRGKDRMNLCLKDVSNAK